MRLYRSREYTVDMGHYEKYKFAVGVTLSHQDFGYTDDDLVQLSEEESAQLAQDMKAAAEEEMERNLSEEIAKAQRNTEFLDSFINKE